MMTLKRFYYPNGTFGGYYIVDSTGLRGGIYLSKERAYKDYRRLRIWIETNIKN